MTLRLTEERDHLLEEMARDLGMSKNLAAAAAIDIAAPRPSHPEQVAASIGRLRLRYSDLMDRLADA